MTFGVQGGFQEVTKSVRAMIVQANSSAKRVEAYSKHLRIGTVGGRG